ncbi:uncharacterized protein LOC134473851 [Cavia porcellus]|uniref:uncharacterized protein LOC134473851 n=1 Tax=Cavia porcellus TaxID=10141 RepID=UPI002FE2F7E9
MLISRRTAGESSAPGFPQSPTRPRRRGAGRRSLRQVVRGPDRLIPKSGPQGPWDVYGIPNTTVSSQEQNQLWQAAQKEANHRHKVQEANKNPTVFLNWLSNPRTLQAVPASCTVLGRLPAPPPCALPAPPSPMRHRRRRRCHLTRFRRQSQPTPVCYVPALAPPAGRALPERRETAAQRLCSVLRQVNLHKVKLPGLPMDHAQMQQKTLSKKMPHPGIL